MNTEDPPRLTELNQRVTEAILFAENLQRQSEQAFAHVSRIEEEIATICKSGTLEGDIARRGAITAALSARDPKRALRLVEQYLRETPVAIGLVTLHREAIAAIRGMP